MRELTYVDGRHGEVTAKRLFFWAFCASQREGDRAVSAIVVRAIVMGYRGNCRGDKLAAMEWCRAGIRKAEAEKSQFDRGVCCGLALPYTETVAGRPDARRETCPFQRTRWG